MVTQNGAQRHTVPVVIVWLKRARVLQEHTPRRVNHQLRTAAYQSSHEPRERTSKEIRALVTECATMASRSEPRFHCACA